MAKILIVILTLTSMNFGFRGIGSNPVLLPILDLYAGDGVMAAHVDISVE
jgi:hypothetical protein